MNRRSRKTRGARHGSAVAALSLAALVGCQSQPQSQSQQAAAPRDEAAPVEPVFVSDGQPIDPRTMSVEMLAARMQEAQEITARKQREAEAQAKARAAAEEAARLKAEQQRLAQIELEKQQMQQTSQATAPTGAEADEVVWLDSRQDGAAVLRDLLMGKPQADAAPATNVATTANGQAVDASASSAVAMPGTPVAVSDAAAPRTVDATPVTIDQRSLVADLVDVITTSDDQPAAKAVKIAALQAVEPSLKMADDVLASLDGDRGEQVVRFADVVHRWAEALQGDTSPVATVWLQKAIDDMRAYEPISIRLTELCKRVDGYGVYTPFDSSTFLAGRANAMIVYVELDNFKAVEIGDGQHEVKLQQAIEVYNEADGLRVWGSSPVQVLDRSRNRRRDFFVVQLIELPARLSVGKYLMKVRITDQHGGSVSETSIPLQFVADTAMVQRANP